MSADPRFDGMSADVTTPAVAKSDEQDAIYQGGRVVGRVLDERVDSGAREIHFGEIYNSDELLLPDDCEFREYRILIQRMEFATREERAAPHKGRVLRGVVAEILGYRKQ
jgi:hypothetical protein